MRLAERRGRDDRREGRPDAREAMPDAILRAYIGGQYLYGASWEQTLEAYGRGYEQTNEGKTP